MKADDEFELEPEYEWLRARVANLDAEESPQSRDVDWLGTARAIGVSRAPNGQIDLFVGGDPLAITDRAVRAASEHQGWSSRDSAGFDATRITLPIGEHFDQVAAFVCAELLKNGVRDDAGLAFARTEPIVALAFRRARSGDSFLLGLAGELLFLRALLQQSPVMARADVLQTWKGADRSTRDFQIGATGVEVKTTTSDVSEHHIHGLAQVNLGHAVDGVVETALYLLSVGVTWHHEDATYGESVAVLIETICADLRQAGCEKDFLAQLAAYGGGTVGHLDVARSPDFRRPFTVDFQRFYDMTDPRIKVPSKADLEDYSHIVEGSLTFRIRLEERINGDLNPLTTFEAATARALG